MRRICHIYARIIRVYKYNYIKYTNIHTCTITQPKCINKVIYGFRIEPRALNRAALFEAAIVGSHLAHELFSNSRH
jgi:hypothetical protein